MKLHVSPRKWSRYVFWNTCKQDVFVWHQSETPRTRTCMPRVDIKARTSNYTLQYLWDINDWPWPWYLLLAYKSSYPKPTHTVDSTWHWQAYIPDGSYEHHHKHLVQGFSKNYGTWTAQSMAQFMPIMILYNVADEIEVVNYGSHRIDFCG